jgi:diketogulonate reductase-like aldo/keto reductase
MSSRSDHLEQHERNTAEMYGDGAAEEVLGEAIAGRRDEVFLASKVLPQNASRRGTIDACRRSLDRLKTDHLDCYLLHWRASHPLEETFAAFEKLRSDGMILSWGVSNFDVPDLKELGKCRNRATSSVIRSCINWRNAPWNMRSFPGARSTGWRWWRTARLVMEASQVRIRRAARILKQIAEHLGATPRQVALQFLVRRPGLFAIPKASTPEHAEENAGAADFRLSEADVEQIDQAFPLGPRQQQLPML